MNIFKHLFRLFAIVLLLFFFATQRNVTATVSSVEELRDGNSTRWLVYTDQGTFCVPYDDEFNVDFLSNIIIWNMDASADWQQIQQPGEYHLRVYSLNIPLLGMRPKITRILQSADEQMFVVVLLKEVALYAKRQIHAEFNREFKDL